MFTKYESDTLWDVEDCERIFNKSMPFHVKVDGELIKYPGMVDLVHDFVVYAKQDEYGNIYTRPATKWVAQDIKYGFVELFDSEMNLLRSSSGSGQ